LISSFDGIAGGFSQEAANETPVHRSNYEGPMIGYLQNIATAAKKLSIKEKMQTNSVLKN
jgi:hypothetical protein